MIQSEKVHFRDVVIRGSKSQRLAYPLRMGLETRYKEGYGQQGATRTIDEASCIFQYTLSGCGLFTDDLGDHLLPAGTGFICESHDPRIGYRLPPGAKEPWEFLYLGFNADPMAALVRELGERRGRVVSLSIQTPAIKRILHLAREEASVLFMDEADAARIVLDMISAIAGSSKGKGASKEDEIIRQIQTLIQQKLADGRIDLIELSEEVGMSRGNLCRFYKQRTGDSPYQYILRKQMLLACQWLLEEHLTVKEVASRLGFSTPANFVRSFKQVTGMTTREFLRQGVLPRL